MIKALFFDIDGTLVSFKTHCIPASTVKALEAAKANGVEIYISTGRPYALINNLSQIEHLIDGYITTNGAYCFIGNKVISCSPIPKDEVRYVIDNSREWGFPCMVVGENNLTMYNTASDAQKVRHISKLLNVPDIEFELPIDDILTTQRILQLTPFISEKQELEILTSLSGIESGRWCPEFADFTAKGVSKAKGLEGIAAYRGFDISETMAFGDGGNDLSIIKQSGIGIAMGNANEVLKRAADYITDDIDGNGIYNALYHHNII